MEPCRRVILDAEAYVYVDLGEATAYNIAEAMHAKGTPCKAPAVLSAVGFHSFRGHMLKSRVS